MNKFIYPSLLKSANIVESHSWFDIKIRKNNRYKKKPKKKKHKFNYIDTFKIKLQLNKLQKNKIKLWLDNCIDVYNLTNQYIKQNLNDKYTNFKDVVNFYNLRKMLNPAIENICKTNKLNKHTADYNVKHCVEMYKSAYSNFKNGHIKKFNIKDLDKNRRRKNLIIEPNSVSKKNNSIFNRQLGVIKSSLSLNKINKNSVLQYDIYKKTFIIISPKESQKEVYLEQYNKCGIDIGVRTFLTVYSPEETHEIGTNTNEKIDKINKRLDKIKSNKDQLKESQYNKLFYKYSDKLKNLINDLHNKAANFILQKFNTIVIGKVSTKNMVSNLKGNLYEIVKRRLMALSHYRFRMKLHQMKIKYNNNIIETNEYMTSKRCCNCSNIKKDLTKEKVYKCDLCKLEIDRDINASINIYHE
jgi:transposase